MKRKNIGIVFADEMEYGPFKEYALQNGGTESSLCGCNALKLDLTFGETELCVTAVESGIGKVCAASSATALICGGAEIILNAGLSGAVSGCIRGQLVAGESCVECDMDLTAIGYKPGEKCGCPIYYEADSALLGYAEKHGLKRARLGTGDIFLTNREKKEYYKNTFGINAFDMESAAIACVCRKCEIPMLSIRQISDDADDSAACDYREMNDKAEATLTEVLAVLFEDISSGL